MVKQSFPTFSLVSQVHDILANYPVKCILQRVEVIDNGEMQQYCSRIVLSIKIIGKLNKDELHTCFNSIDSNKNCSKIRSLSLHTLPVNMAMYDLTDFSPSQQILEMQRYIRKESNKNQSFYPGEAMSMQIFFLQEKMHILHLTLYQPDETNYPVNRLIYRIVNCFCLNNEIEQSSRTNEMTLHGLIENTSLTSREVEVLQCVAGGLSNREIAQRCVITEGTVKRHMNNIYSKLAVSSRTQAIARAKKLQLLE